jgi:putative copper export protein
MDGWLTLSALLHLVALALWLGGGIFFLAVFGPAVRQLDPSVGVQLLNRGRHYFEALSWIAITLLVLTGIVNLILRSQASTQPLAQSYLVALSINSVVFSNAGAPLLAGFQIRPQLSALTGKRPPAAACRATARPMAKMVHTLRLTRPWGRL